MVPSSLRRYFGLDDLAHTFSVEETAESIGFDEYGKLPSKAERFRMADYEAISSHEFHGVGPEWTMESAKVECELERIGSHGPCSTGFTRMRPAPR